jgi:hypothetical protein
MGKGIDQQTFGQLDYARFRQWLGQCLSTLGRLLERPGFGVGPATLGAELELFLVDDAARPRLRNQAAKGAGRRSLASCQRCATMTSNTTPLQIQNLACDQQEPL